MVWPLTDKLSVSKSAKMLAGLVLLAFVALIVVFIYREQVHNPYSVAAIPEKVENKFGTTYEVTLNLTTGIYRCLKIIICNQLRRHDIKRRNRFYVVHEPKSLNKHVLQQGKVPILFFFHGKQGTAWEYALEWTKWAERSYVKGSFWFTFQENRKGSL